MKSKLTWITFVPLFCAACFFKLAQKLFPEKAVFGFSALEMEYLYLAAVALIFLFTVVFCLLDRKISAYYLTNRNIPAGIFGLLAALSLAADGADSAFRMLNSGAVDVLQLIGALLSMISAITFTVFGLNHLFFNRDAKRFSLLYVIPALLFSIRMIICFVSFTTVSVRFADVSGLICYVLAALFFYYFAVMLAVIKTKNNVKYCFIFGFPAVAALIPYGLYHLIFDFNANDIIKNLQPLELLLLGLYIFCFLIEITALVRDRSHITVIELNDQKDDLSDEKIEGFITGNAAEDENDRIPGDSSYLEAGDTEGFLYRETPPVDAQSEIYADVDADQDVDHYLTQVQDEDQDPDIENQRPSDYVNSLDEIDKLILDISKENN